MIELNVKNVKIPGIEVNKNVFRLVVLEWN